MSPISRASRALDTCATGPIVWPGATDDMQPYLSAPLMCSELESIPGSCGGPPVERRLASSLRGYWLDRAAQHTHDSYAGVPISKFPEDLRVYEHLMWADRTNVVIELGSDCGGSALWFRDRLQTLAAYGLISEFRVITIDIRAEEARVHLDGADPRWEENIVLVPGDVRDENLPALVAELVPPRSRCFVVEDSAHVYDTTTAALAGFAQFVPPGGFFMVEDGCVDIAAMRLDECWPRGVLPAIKSWLATPEGGGFIIRRDLELYGMTCHPGGLLQRREFQS
jgi:cephalosporin hydroxylase